MLTEKQKRFADYYIETGNGSEAYKRAYKTCKKDDTARVNASKLLTKANVKEYIAQTMKEKDNKRIASQDEVLEYLTAIMRGEIKEECVVVESKGDFESQARTIDKQVSPKDRNKAAELLGKRYALWIDKQKIDAELAPKIVDDIE